MLNNYLKIALRNLTRNGTYSFINIFGLAVGIASSVLILLWVADEYSFDKFHENYESIYRVYQRQEWAQGIGTGTSLPYKLKEAIKNKSSQVKHVVMTNWGEGNMLQVGEKRLNKFGMSATEDFFTMFSFNMIKGNPKTALSDPSSIVITETTAKSFFGEQDPINQLIKVDNGQELKVTGVVKDAPGQSSFQFDYIFPFAYYEATQAWAREAKEDWADNGFQMYVQLQPGATEADVNNSIKYIVRDNNPKAPTSILFLHPMSKWRLYSNFENGKNTGGMIEYVQLFTAIAIFVVIIACINFMNLATARSESRAREVGIRKSVGSRRKELIAQFLGESLLITLISFLLALVLVELLLPSYNILVEKNISINYSNPLMWASALGLILVIGIFSGSYPAFYLSSFQPVKVLKGKLNIGKGASAPRQVLVTLQFGFSIFLIIGTIVIYQQVMHVKNREVGYDRENLMQIWTNNELESNFKTVREELVRTGVVKSVCKSNSPITRIFSSNDVEWPGMPTGQRISFSTIATEYDYTETMGIKILEGRDFSRDFKSDSMAVLVNKAAIDLMGIKNPIGQKIKVLGDQREIIGVMDNVVMASPYLPIEPLTLTFSKYWSSTVTIRLNKTQDLKATLDKVSQVFKKLNPNYPFEFRFADSEFATKFSAINLISRLAGIFASLAIVITCLGLLGLAAFTAAQRTKEMGIRKILGASVASLVVLLSKDFSKLVIIAFFIASPIAWWFLNNFLERYPYRIHIMWWMLPIAGLAALVLALVIVSTQAIKAAVSNPVNSLRSE